MNPGLEIPTRSAYLRARDQSRFTMMNTRWTGVKWPPLVHMSFYNAKRCCVNRFACSMRLPRITMYPVTLRILAAIVLCHRILCAAEPSSIQELRREFQQPPDDCRIMMRWWWFGPAVTKTELEREMRTMKDGGIGGFEVQPVYPLSLDDPEHGIHNLPYLSPEFLDALHFTAQKARELGLRFDLTLGSGWPFGGPYIPITEAAGKLRADRVSVPEGAHAIPLPRIGDGEKFIAAFLAPNRRLSVDENNSVQLPADAGSNGTALFFIASRTRMRVKRPAVGAEGYVLDHYDQRAIDTHLKAAGDKMMDAVGEFKPHAVFSDSLEVYNSGWTGDFLDEFRKRRGYDLTPYLPALAMDIGEKTAEIRHDWGETLTELANERYLAPIREWAHAHGTLFRSQTYGIPPVNLSSNALVDLPEGEGWQWPRFSATRWASSASHLYGRPVTSSETWTWLHSPVFRATPLDMKAEADLHFLEGINQLVGHGWPYSPPSAGEPGWHFYAAAVFNAHNPWWLVMPDIAKYLQRVSFLLRQGRPVNDVALYLPTHDALAGFTLAHDSVNQAMDGLLGPNVIRQIEEAGYSFDFIDDAAIATGGIPYRVLVLPNVERIPLPTYRKIEAYARSGRIVIATRRAPSTAPGFLESDRDTPQIRQISAELFPGHTLVEDDQKLGQRLRSVLKPDVQTVPEIGFVERKLPFADVYFLVNTSNHAVKSSASFLVGDRAAAWWNPSTGEIEWASNGNSVELALAPYESRILVFSNERIPPPTMPAGRTPPTIDISTDWKVTFAGHAPVTMKNLHSWTDDEEHKYFSGSAIYERIVNLPTQTLSSGHPIYMSFGEGTPVMVEEHRAGSGMRAMLESPVREAAVVYVNGKRAGSVWAPPYEIEIGRLLHAGDNELRIVVANLAVNELAAQPPPDYSALNARYGERFQPQDVNAIKPYPSGILGPVRLIAK